MMKLRTVLLVASLLILCGCKEVAELPYSHGFAAQNLCSGIFVSGIDEDRMRDDYVGPNVYPLAQVWKLSVNYERKMVTSHDLLFNGKNDQTAYYRPGLGCTLLQGRTPAELDAQIPRLRQPVSLPSNEYWPTGSAGVWPFRKWGVNYRALDKALNKAFEPSPDYRKQTMAVLVAYDNRLIAEKYDPSIDANTRLLGWSMTKSFTATFIGMLLDRGMLDLKSPAPLAQWQQTDKASITIENLLHMASGIEFHEQATGPHHDLAVMLYGMPRFSDILMDRPLVARPGTVFNYSTADTMMLARIGQDALGGTLADTYHFLFDNLFDPIGIVDPVLQYDASGYPGGGSYLLMKPRDWARLGLLYLNRGNWFGKQVLSRQWVDYALSPSSANTRYGAQIWTNTNRGRWRSLPADTFAFLGHQGQSVFVVPSRKLVVVRMGFTFGGDGGLELLVRDVIRSLPSH